MAPAASVRVGEISSKSRLRKKQTNKQSQSVEFSRETNREAKREKSAITGEACREVLAGLRIRKGDSPRCWVDRGPIRSSKA